MNKSHPMHALIHQNLTRNQQIIICYRASNTQQEIADAFGITRARVQQILKRHGITKKDSARTPRGRLFAAVTGHVSKAAKVDFVAACVAANMSESKYCAQLIMTELRRLKE